MTELRNVEADLSRFRARVLAASALVLACFALLAARLVWLQVVRHEDLNAQADLAMLAGEASQGRNDARWLRETQGREGLLAETVRLASREFRGAA